jgi:hypothetical protein
MCEVREDIAKTDEVGSIPITPLSKVGSALGHKRQVDSMAWAKTGLAASDSFLCELSGIQQGWTHASARKSPAYTTDWDSLIQVKATCSYPMERE